MFFDCGTVTIHDTTVAEWDAPDDVPAPPTASDTGSGAADPAAIGAIGHHRQWSDLISAIHAGSTPAVPATESIHTLALIEAIYRSAEQGIAVTVGRETS
jgi:predicted dehydrogenase